MRVGILTWGSTGDINPMFAIAEGLVAAGHTVQMALLSAESEITQYQCTAERLGITMTAIDCIFDSENDAAALIRGLWTTRNPLKHLQTLLGELIEPSGDWLWRQAAALAAQSDVLVAHHIVHQARLAAERARIAHVSVTFTHALIGDAAIAPGGLPGFGRWINRALWWAAKRRVNALLLPGANAQRAKLGAGPVDDYRALWQSDRCDLLPVSKVFFRQPVRAPHQACGFLSTPHAVYVQAQDAAIEAFLNAGAPPVCFTFGSMLAAERDPHIIRAMVDLICAAARDAGVRAIIQAPWHLIGAPPHDHAVLGIKTADFSQLFARCALIVHHGGAGTSHAALRAGKPSVVVAHIADQFFWASELKRLGVAQRALDRRSVSAAKLARAVRNALGDESLAVRARSLATQMQAENSVQNAVAMIEACVAKA